LCITDKSILITGLVRGVEAVGDLYPRPAVLVAVCDGLLHEELYKLAALLEGFWRVLFDLADTFSERG
jgi:hypothetical protein